MISLYMNYNFIQSNGFAVPELTSIKHSHVFAPFTDRFVPP